MIMGYHRIRRAVGAMLLLLLVGLPFLRVNGESALRFDVPTLRFLFFGTQTGMADSFIILIALIFITFFILFVTTLFGRVWCGWFCPQTVLCDATGFMEKARSRGFVARSLAVLAGRSRALSSLSA
jgi:polyferredoxin